MSVKAINSALGANEHNRLNSKNNQAKPNFTGSFNPVVTLMDAIDKGGFAASFIAQDGIGMVAPRIYEGLNRNRKEDENGKKTGPLNWEFARREGIREILSGPSAFLIPLGILSVVKKASGTANNVHTNHIEVLGNSFADYAKRNFDKLQDHTELKKGYYTEIFENALENSTDESFRGAELKATAQKFADKLVEAELKRANKDKKGSNKLYASIVDEYMKLRKAHAAPSSEELEVSLKVSGKDKNLGTNIRRLTQSLTDYSGDVLKNIKNKNPKDVQDLEKFINNFNKHRIGTRIISNLGMWGAVVAFYTLIPKLYNIGIKHDPGLKGLEGAQDTPEESKKNADDIKDKKNKEDKKDVAFTGSLAAKLGDTATKSKGLNKLLKNFEFNGASMPVNAMLTLLFGFCLPPRYVNAKSDKERKEILVRDISSFVAILFGAKALSRGFSGLFAKTSGLALNFTPKDHDKSIFHKVKNYFTAGQGIEVLTSEQIVSKYSNISDYKDGINGFFKFLEENGGNVKKVLKIDKSVKENTETILKQFNNGKSLKDSTIDEIKEAFKKAKGSDALENIYSVFSSSNNKFINRAKTYNSAFGFASTIVLVPVFMMWLARYCEGMTKRAIAKEKEEKLEQEKANQPKLASVGPAKQVQTNKPSMAGFLSK